MLSALGRNYMLAFAKGWRPMRLDQGTRFYLLPNVPLPRVRQGMFLVAAFVLTVYLACFRGVCVVVSQGIYDALALIAARRLLRLVGRRMCVVVQVHGDWEEAAFLLGKLPRVLAPLVKLLSRVVLRNADVVRVISEFTLNKAYQYVPDGKPHTMFPGFTNIDLFLEEYEPSSTLRTPTLLYPGALTRLKGVHVLIEALRLLREKGVLAELVVAGDGEERGKLAEQARRAGLGEHVSFVGFVEQSELRRLMRESYALVLPSLSEGFGRVVIEAMACRKPVVASRTGGIPELVRDGENGLLAEPGNPSDLMEKVRYLVEHPDVARRMGRNGRRFVRETYSNASYFAHYRRLLEIAARTLAGTEGGV